MAVITNIVATIKMRSDIYTEWYNKNPVLASGEIAYNKTDGTIKIGDGATAWRLLPSSVLTTRTIAGKNLSSNITAESLKTALALVKNDVELGSVLNYGIAADTDAKAGTSNELYMTPLRVKEAIDTFPPASHQHSTDDIIKTDRYEM